MAKNSKSKTSSGSIAQNKKARFDYFLVEKFEAGLMLQGWEVKSLREGKGQLTDSYVFFKNGEAFLLNCQIQPLPTASTHFVCEPTRYRKLLLHKNQIEKLAAHTDQKGYTVVATALYWKGHMVKCEVCIAKGKQLHDKRQTEKERDSNREMRRALQHSTR